MRACTGPCCASLLPPGLEVQLESRHSAALRRVTTVARSPHSCTGPLGEQGMQGRPLAVLSPCCGRIEMGQGYGGLPTQQGARAGKGARARSRCLATADQDSSVAESTASLVYQERSFQSCSDRSEWRGQPRPWREQMLQSARAVATACPRNKYFI